MPSNDDLHQYAPDRSGVALIIIDMINDLEFCGGEAIFDAALAAAENIAALKQRAQGAGIPIIFANDNFGRWRSNFREAVEHCLKGKVKGSPLAELLNPAPGDYFILKPKHSAFYATPLELLLQHLGCRHLILCGISGDMCVQFTACDAYMRDFALHVPADCMASKTADANRTSLNYMQSVLGANVTPSDQFDLEKMLDRA